MDSQWAASVPVNAVFLPQLRRLFLIIACNHTNSSFLVRHWMSPTLQSLTLQGAISHIPIFEIPDDDDMHCCPNVPFAMGPLPTLYDRPLLTKLAIHTDGIVYERIRQFLPPSLTHFTYTAGMNGSLYCDRRRTQLDAGRIFTLLPSKLLRLRLAPVTKDSADKQKLPEDIRENPLFKLVLTFCFWKKSE